MISGVRPAARATAAASRLNSSSTAIMMRTLCADSPSVSRVSIFMGGRSPGARRLADKAKKMARNVINFAAHHVYFPVKEDYVAYQPINSNIMGISYQSICGGQRRGVRDE